MNPISIFPIIFYNKKRKIGSANRRFFRWCRGISRETEFTENLQIVLENGDIIRYNITWIYFEPVLVRTGKRKSDMKDLRLLVWLTQLGFSVAFPLAGFILLAVWLRDRWGWGDWVLWVGIVIGVSCAIDGLRSSLKVMAQFSRGEKKDPPPTAFNDHD